VCPRSSRRDDGSLLDIEYFTRRRPPEGFHNGKEEEELDRRENSTRCRVDILDVESTTEGLWSTSTTLEATVLDIDYPCRSIALNSVVLHTGSVSFLFHPLFLYSEDTVMFKYGVGEKHISYFVCIIELLIHDNFEFHYLIYVHICMFFKVL
jgi:hypothetical protein